MSVYNQAQVVVIVDGVEQKGLAEGDSIVVSRAGQGSTVTAPGAGDTRGSTSYAADRTGTISITYKDTSESITAIKLIDIAQSLGQAVPIDIFVKGGSGDLVNCFGCSVQNLGDKTTGGPVHSQRTVIFNVERIDEV